LVPKQIKAHGLKASQFKISTALLEKVVTEYTRESGVRGLDKMIAKLVRNRAKWIAMDKPLKGAITADEVEQVLGVGISQERYLNNEVAGVVTGLAWTSVGGDVLYIESSITPGKGKLTLTGNLGEVMKESIHAAETVVKSRARSLGITRKFLRKHNVHIHVPEGATPKDGPSAGVGMVTAMVSAMTRIPVRADVAMTGEITLRGEVLPIGGLKEKLLAAHRGGIKLVLIPRENEKDLAEVPENVKKGLEIRPVKWIDEVLSLALETLPHALADDEDLDDDDVSAGAAAALTSPEEEGAVPARTH
jgi:ATP-dependent Lon protease